MGVCESLHLNLSLYFFPPPQQQLFCQPLSFFTVCSTNDKIYLRQGALRQSQDALL
jgi:hypothetical protein